MTSTPTATERSSRRNVRWTICPGCTAVVAPLVPGEKQQCRFCNTEFVLVPPKQGKQRK
jgi:hypothetical protein